MLNIIKEAAACVPDKCFEWTGYIDNKGYGRVRFRDEARLAHRVSYILNVGEINDNLFVCHKCDNRKCINPSHLFLGTNRDNMQDASNKGRVRNQNSNKTECKNGHQLSGDNLVITSVGTRQCKICLNNKTRRYRERIRARRIGENKRVES